MPHPGLTLRSIGGVMDLYLFLGSSPTEALQQYITTVGLPVMPPYWALGFQLCRSVEQVSCAFCTYSFIL